MEQTDLAFDQKELSHLLYGSQPEFDKFIASKELKYKYDFLKFRPETYANEPNQHLAEEGRVLVELIKLQRSNELSLKQLAPLLKDLTPYARIVQTHFSLFKNLCLAFASQKNTPVIQNLIDNMTIVGSVLLQELDFNRNTVEDTAETTATFQPETGKFLLNTPTDKAKLCRFYTPHSTHVIVFARIKTPSAQSLSSPYPFLIQLRNPQSLELLNGINMKWLGPSFGGISGREYAFEFKDFPVEADKLLLDKYVTCSNKKLEIKGDNTAIDYTTRICLLLEQDQLVERSIREALKASFLTVRHANNRTQFQTLEEKFPCDFPLGKERPIFEYNYNKTRIMKALIETLNLHFVWTSLRKEIYSSLPDTQKNSKKFNEIFLVYDVFEAFVNERCLINIEALRESLGGIGYLKYSGIPTLQENAMKNAVYTGPSKELRYIKFAQLFVNTDFKKPGEFLGQFASWIVRASEGTQAFEQEGFSQNIDFFRLFLSKKYLTVLLHYKKKITDTYPLKPSDCSKELLKQITNFDGISKLCESFVSLLKVSSVVSRADSQEVRTNKKFLLTLLATDITINILDDVPFFLLQEGKLFPQSSLNIFSDNFARYIDTLGKISVPLVESFGFDENLLHSCIAKTADETYEKMLNMSKNHNPRNDPKVQDDIRADLLKFLNRPAKPNL